MRIPGIDKLNERRERREAVAEASGKAPAGPLLKGYGPLAAFGILFVMMAGLVPTVNQQDVAGARFNSALPGEEGFAPDATDDDPNAPISDAGGNGEVASGSGPVTSSGGSGGGGGDDGGGGTTVTVPPGRGEGSCEGKARQVPGDPYSPPCIEWAGGNNGGATAPGVTPDTVKLSFRTTAEKGFLQTLATLAGADIVDTPADIERTVETFEQFFNQHYQFYGRKIDVQFFKGSGQVTVELLGGGRDAAVADAAAIKEEINPFIEMNAASEPFADAIYKEQIVGFGTPYLSRKWHNDRRPYAWSIATDCSIVSEVAAEFTNKMLTNENNRKKAIYAADPNFHDTERVVAGMAPENTWYQECVQNAADVLAQEGNEFGINWKYKLDINSMSNQAAAAVAKLKDTGATTILCGCDPIWPVFLTAKAQEQGYGPEWIVLGTALTDSDIAGQLYDQEQWAHAFGVSSLGEPRPIRAGLGYTAYKSIRNDEPAFAVEIIYGSMLMIASGIQMAGPNLNPLTFEAALKKWPGGSGPYGTWGFEAADYTPTRDYRVIYWERDATSIVNNQRGAYQTAFDGQRYEPGKFPRLEGQPPVLENA